MRRMNEGGRTVATKREFTDEELRAGQMLYEYEDYSCEDHMQLARAYEGLRVSDVVDALQAVGIQDTGLMDKSIRPLWQDHGDSLKHRICGAAITHQYFPTNRPHPGLLDYEEFNQWHGRWYRDIAPETFTRVIEPGTVLVVDAHGTANTGFIGSNNALGWKSKGLRGVVTNGSCRDIDEVILQNIPIYSRFAGGGTRPGRMEEGTVNLPVVVGGVLVRPWDMVVADGDGVVVVPREYAARVGDIARDIALSDKKIRTMLYRKVGLDEDSTLS